MQGSNQTGHHQGVNFQPHAEHTKWISDTVKTVNNEFPGNNVNDFTVHCQRHNSGGLHNPLNILFPDLTVFTTHRHYTAITDQLNV